VELSLNINLKDCVGCHACEVACKQEHNLPVGPKLISVTPDDPKFIEGKTQLRYSVAHCLQCSEPACREACPTGAIGTRDDGIVIIDGELCNGCGLCVEACSYGAMQIDETKRTARKCDLCAERLDKGLQPACVTVCPSHCVFLRDKEANRNVRVKKIAGRV
jgi:Fe-S-cluster-containing dehydrogenase component